MDPEQYDWCLYKKKLGGWDRDRHTWKEEDHVKMEDRGNTSTSQGTLKIEGNPPESAKGKGMIFPVHVS